jgi:hypothetical protein
LKLHREAFTPDVFHAARVDVFSGPTPNEFVDDVLDAIHTFESIQTLLYPELPARRNLSRRVAVAPRLLHEVRVTLLLTAAVIVFSRWSSRVFFVGAALRGRPSYGKDHS